MISISTCFGSACAAASVSVSLKYPSLSNNDDTRSRDDTGPQRNDVHSLVSVKCKPRSAFGLARAYVAISESHGHGTMILPELTSPVSSAFIVAALTEWAIPRSSA